MTARRTGGSSGIAAIAAEMPASTFAPSDWPLMNPSPETIAIRPIATTRRIRTRRSSSCWSGERRSIAPVRRPAIRPTSVPVPIATTIPSPRPPTTLVPANAIARRSATTASRRVRIRSRRLRDGLPGEDAAVNEQPVRAADAKIGRDDVAAAQEDHVARDEGRGRDVRRHSPSPDTRHRRGGVAESVERPLAPVFGHDVRAHDRQEPDQDEDSVADLVEEDRGEPGRGEEQDKRFGRRVDHHPEHGFPLPRLELVRACRGRSRGDLVRVQAGSGIHAQRRGDLGYVESVGGGGQLGRRRDGHAAIIAGPGRPLTGHIGMIRRAEGLLGGCRGRTWPTGATIRP